MASLEEIKSVKKVTEYMEAFDFEVFHIEGVINLFRQNRPVLYTIVGIYLMAIYLGRRWMENRQAFKLKIPLFLWNVCLALFSIVATLRIMPEVLYILARPGGFYLSICVMEPHNYATSFWGLLFVLSKFVELGDTAFIVLRKQKLIILHWFHHTATLALGWIGFEAYDIVCRYIFLNTLVHSFMYSYYALKALNITISRKISKALTTLQIVQMFTVLYLLISTAIFQAQGRPCRITEETLGLFGIVILMFTVLFLNFFWKAYVRKGKRFNSYDKNRSLRKVE